jgi:hypothetical protein
LRRDGIRSRRTKEQIRKDRKPGCWRYNSVELPLALHRAAPVSPDSIATASARLNYKNSDVAVKEGTVSFYLRVGKTEPQLTCVAQTAILVSMREAWHNCRQRKSQPEEPDFVASLVINGTTMLEAGWRPLLRPYHVRVTGIYCHQTPKVSFSGMSHRSCELGDLLWCHVHTDRQGVSIRNAMLCQAKRSSRRPYRILSKESDQMRLYSSWPEFVYVHSGWMYGQKRHVRPAAPRKGAQYLLIDDRPPEQPEAGLLGIPGTYAIGSCIAQDPLVDHSDLGSELVAFMELLSGDPFDDMATASAETGWSTVIWDLLQMSVKKAFRRTGSGYFNQPRAAGAPPSTMDGYLSTQSQQPSKLTVSILGENQASTLFLHSMQDPPVESEGEWDDEEDGGISVIIIETHDPIRR